MNKETMQKVSEEIIESYLSGKSDIYAYDSLTTIEKDMEELKKVTMQKALTKRAELVTEIVNSRNNYKSNFEQASQKLKKYEADMKKLQDFKISFNH